MRAIRSRWPVAFQQRLRQQRLDPPPQGIVDQTSDTRDGLALGHATVSIRTAQYKSTFVAFEMRSKIK